MESHISSWIIILIILHTHLIVFLCKICERRFWVSLMILFLFVTSNHNRKKGQSHHINYFEIHGILTVAYKPECVWACGQAKHPYLSISCPKTLVGRQNTAWISKVNGITCLSSKPLKVAPFSDTALILIFFIFFLSKCARFLLYSAISWLQLLAMHMSRK